MSSFKRVNVRGSHRKLDIRIASRTAPTNRYGCTCSFQQIGPFVRQRFGLSEKRPVFKALGSFEWSRGVVDPEPLKVWMTARCFRNCATRKSQLTRTLGRENQGQTEW